MDAIRTAYAREGVDAFYARAGATYRNPHEPGIRAAVQAFVPLLPRGRVLDLACGSGEVTLALGAAGVDDVEGADPYTGAAYRERTGREALPWSFADLPEVLVDRRYAAVICSFALHLCEASRLPGAVIALAASTERLLVLTPHKRPELRPSWGFALLEERYDPEWRVRSRLYAR